jgi:hypothetical protein
MTGTPDPSELTPAQVQQLETAYAESIAEIDRDDAQHVLAKEPKARRKLDDLIKG